ncbi:SDR family NAD(P)-dependent oxidoreductase [Brevundimonas diminuta]|uniref:SDR family NAD(P)-dependent oxidoreductase n=1 Tax=Brevundimonas diminuta TaxID=293 RepID=UPI00405A0EEE
MKPSRGDQGGRRRPAASRGFADQTGFEDDDRSQVFAPGGTVYSGTKFAVSAISEGLRHEVGEKVRVTSIEPGTVESDLKFTTSGTAAETVLDFYKQAIPAASVALSRSLSNNLMTSTSTRSSSGRPHSSSDFDEEAGPRVLRLMGNVPARSSITLPNDICPFNLRSR